VLVGLSDELGKLDPFVERYLLLLLVFAFTQIVIVTLALALAEYIVVE